LDGAAASPGATKNGAGGCQRARFHIRAHAALAELDGNPTGAAADEAVVIDCPVHQHNAVAAGTAVERLAGAAGAADDVPTRVIDQQPAIHDDARTTHTAAAASAADAAGNRPVIRDRPAGHYIAASLLLNPDRTVGVEQPSYPDIRNVCRHLISSSSKTITIMN
jgi:hypothetical protein